jgi:hypothetical protein
VRAKWRYHFLGQIATQERSKVPKKNKYYVKRVYARLDGETAEALQRLIEYHGKDESKLIREAIIEKERNDVPPNWKPKQNTA